MTHDEFVSRAEDLTDSDSEAVLAHARACRSCRREGSRVDRAISGLVPPRSSRLEEVARVAAAAAVCAVLLDSAFGAPPPPPSSEARSRYRIVGDASGVVAYTPNGIVAAAAAAPARRKGEVTR